MRDRWPTRATTVPVGPQAGPAHRLSAEQATERILRLNPSATPAFLSRFDAQALSDYLEHLLAARRPRGEGSRWVRPAGARAITVDANAG